MAIHHYILYLVVPLLFDANDFIWPGPDLRTVEGADPGTVAFGFLPPGFTKVLRERLESRWRERRAVAVQRTQVMGAMRRAAGPVMSETGSTSM